MKEDTLHQGPIGDVRGAILEERMNTLIGDMKELKESSRQLVTLLVDLTKVQGDIQATTKEVAALSVEVGQSKKDNEAVGKHVAVVSMWGRVALGLMTVVIGFMGWGMLTVVDAVRSFDKLDNRLTSLETIVNAKALESTFDSPVLSPQILPSPPVTPDPLPTRRRQP